MPPKKKNTHNTYIESKTQTESLPLIPIYQSLKNANSLNPIEDLVNRIEKSFKQNPEILKRSLLIFLIRCCGLQHFAADFDFDQSIQSLNKIIERVSEQKLSINAQPLILHSKDSSHHQFIKRFKQLLEILISDSFQIVFDQKIQLLPSFLAWTNVLTKSKIRIIRSCAIQFLKYFINQQLRFFNYLMTQKKSKKAFVISKNISYYLENVLCQRINDVDSIIRETTFNLVRDILVQIQSQLLNQAILRKLFDNSINQKPKIIQNVLQIILDLLEKTKNKKQVMKYLSKHLPNLEYLALNPNYNGILSLKILMEISKIDPNLDSLKPSIIAKIFHNYSQQKYLSGLSLAVDVFFHSLYPDEEMIQINATIVLTQILNLLGEINNEKHIKIILRQFFTHHKKKADLIFSFESLFNLLLSQYYRNGSQDVTLNKTQLSMLAITICEYTDFCEQRWKQSTVDKQKYSDYLQTYNNLLLTSSKEIFFQKIQNKNYQKIVHNYLRMFSLIHLPIIGSLQSYLDFIIQRVQNMFFEEIGNGEVYKQIVNIFQKLQISHIKKLAQKLQINQDSSEILSKQNIYRISSILGKYNIPSLLTHQILNIYINTFDKVSSSSISQKTQIMIILKIFIEKVFENLIQNPTHSLANFYKFTRDKILSFLTQILDNTEENLIIKLCCFKTLLNIIQFVGNHRFQQINSSIVFQLDEKKYRVIYGFVSYHFGINIQNQDATLDISRLMSALSFQNLQIKEQMVKTLFLTYKVNYTFACNPYSVKFILYLLKKQAELKERNLNKSSIQYLEGFQSKTISNYVEQLLIKYAFDESLQINQNKVVYWRLCAQLLHQSYNEAEHDSLLNKIITIYFKKKLQTQNHKRLLNKLLISLIGSVQKLILKGQFEKIDIYFTILKKVYRRYEKSILLRFKQYISRIVQRVDNPYLNEFLAYVNDISKTLKDKKTRNKMDMENQQQLEPEKDQNNQDGNKMEIQQEDTKNNKAKKNDTENRRFTRSSMKQKQRN